MSWMNKVLASGMPKKEFRMRRIISDILEHRIQSGDRWWSSLIDVLVDHYSKEDEEPLVRMRDVVMCMPFEHIEKLHKKIVHQIEWEKHQKNLAKNPVKP